jgi:lauroyl/myristoyl acyltransferase
VTSSDETRALGTTGLRDLWSSRQSLYPRVLWALMMRLDLLPWPLGEDLLAYLFAAVTLMRGSRRRAALAWASQQPGRRAWRLALAVSAFRGRWVARLSLLGLRRPDDLRRQVSVHGEEHLAAAPGGAILLGFHLGPPNVDVALRILGHRVAWLGTARRSRAWSKDAWRPLLDPKDNLCPSEATWFWPGTLYRARRLLLDGGALFILADAWAGREVFQVPLPGGCPLILRAGWLTLWRQTGARVLPVTTHLDGRVQVVTIHPPLPTPGEHDADLPPEWSDILASLVKDYVRRFPEQCPVLPFPQRPLPGSVVTVG